MNTKPAANPTVLNRPKVRIGPRSMTAGKPEVRIKKVGNSIEAITVVCSCGEEIEINCVYSEGQ